MCNEPNINIMNMNHMSISKIIRILFHLHRRYFWNRAAISHHALVIINYSVFIMYGCSASLWTHFDAYETENPLSKNPLDFCHYWCGRILKPWIHSHLFWSISFIFWPLNLFQSKLQCWALADCERGGELSHRNRPMCCTKAKAGVCL